MAMWKVQRSENYKQGWIVTECGTRISKFMAVSHALMIVKNHNAEVTKPPASTDTAKGEE